MQTELSWDSYVLPAEALRWRDDIERASGLRVRLLRDDEMRGAEGEAWSEPGLRAVAVSAHSDDVITIVHELGHLKLETEGWPHCYLSHDDPRWLEWHYALISDLVSLIEHQAFYPAMLRMGLDPYAAAEADLTDPDVLDELRDLAPSLPLPGLKPDWAITMQLLRALLETSPAAAERIMRWAAQLGPERRMAETLAAIIRAAPLTPEGFVKAMRDCWQAMGFAEKTLLISAEPYIEAARPSGLPPGGMAPAISPRELNESL